jgi:zinc protease
MKNTFVKMICTVVLLASLAVAQKQAPMPKDLPPYGTEKPLRTPSVMQTKLDNGMNVWLVSEPGFPKVALRLVVRGGLAADPTDRPGISELLSKAITQGTPTRSARQIAEEVEETGGDLKAEANKDSVEISTVVLSSKVDEALEVLADIAQNASFPEGEVNLAKRNLSDSLEQREAEPRFLAERARDNVLFANHPYHVTAATKACITATSRADLQAIFAQRFRPDQAMLVVVGDFRNDRLLAAIKGKFGSWKAPANAPKAAPPEPSTAVEHAVFLVARPGSIQSTLELATFAPRLGDPNYATAQVVNAFYGGEFSSRLVSNIREDKGYTYSPYSFLRSFQMSAELVSRADVRNEVTAPALNEIEYELNRLATTSPSNEELSSAKRYLAGSEALELQDRASLARRLGSLWISGLPPAQIGIYGQQVTSTTEADVNMAARRYFAAYRMAIIAVGEESVIRDAAATLGLSVQRLP